MKFVTLFPWNDGDLDDDPAGECSFDVINPSENETALLLIDYGDNLHGSGKQLVTINVTVPPASSVKVRRQNKQKFSANSRRDFVVLETVFFLKKFPRALKILREKWAFGILYENSLPC